LTERREFEFGGGSIAEDYDDVLVPLMFDPWAELLIGAMPPESSWDILDLATGTGIVASKIAPRLGAAGSLTAADVSADMLAVARARLEAIESAARIEIVETPAHPLRLPDASMDAIYCQQGFQFFPDQGAAAIEMHRVSRPGGRLAVATWCPLSECDFFGMIADCLRRIGEAEAAAMMATPFDHMPQRDLEAHFVAAGFRNVSIDRLARKLVFEGGVDQAYRTMFATPIAPRLADFSPEKTEEFRSLFYAEAEDRTRDGVTSSRLVSLLLTGEK
jgi:ubiquinone/menaquinone biosynthesis C-methylase UbiE